MVFLISSSSWSQHCSSPSLLLLVASTQHISPCDYFPQLCIVLSYLWNAASIFSFRVCVAWASLQVPAFCSLRLGVCEKAMALVTMITPLCGALHAQPLGLRGIVPSSCCKQRTCVSRDVGDCRVPGEKRKVMAQTPGAAASAASVSMDNFASVEELKAALLDSVEGLNRGIFGVQNARKVEVESLLQLLEAASPAPRPTENLDKVKGEWKLLYSTISILGSKRTKLGLRDFISLGDFVQIIDVDQEKAVNRVTFSVAGLGMLSGSFTIEASFKIVSPTRVDIKFENSALVPEQLLSLFQKNYDLLLSIFNPEGWLEITYVDDTLRVGRDDKGNVFLLEKV